MKESSPTPYLRFGGNVDERLQDFQTIELLCDDCENRFSAWETKFASGIFHPSAAGEATFWYGPWLLGFAASLAWRAIQYRQFQRIEDWPTLTPLVDDMEFHLSQFLLGREKNVGSYTQHIYPVDILASPTNPGSPMLNRYLARAVEIDFLRTDDLSEVMVYVKIPMFMFFSVGKSKYRKWLETSRIKKSSLLRPKNHVLPISMGDYILKRSDRMKELVDSMSPRSKAIADKAIGEAIRRDPEQVANSGLMQATLADYEFYGDDALTHPD